MSGNTLCTMHTFCHPTLQHHNSYNRTETIGSGTQSVLLMMGIKTVHTSCHPTLQHYNTYNRTETICSETQSDLLMMGGKGSRNLLRNN